jgi:hypothetical protein
MRTTKRRGRTNPHCISNKIKENMILVSLPDHYEEFAEGEGVHCLDPEAYFIWIEEQMETAVVIDNDVYWY